VERDGKITQIETTYTMVATGSEARSLPGVEIDGSTILTNREILQLDSVPKSLVVVGCGAVGVEFASIFRTFGSEVTLLEMLPRIVPLEDEEISLQLEKSFKKKGIRIETGAKVETVRKDSKGATVSFKDRSGKEQSIAAEKVLIGVGRRPLTEDIGRATRVRYRRYRGGVAAAGPCGFDGGHYRRRANGRKGGAAL